MAKKGLLNVLLVNTETGTSYVKIRGTKKPKLSLKKYDPKLRKHVLFVEKKA